MDQIEAKIIGIIEKHMKYSSTLARIIDYVNKYYKENISLDTAAEKINLSSKYLSSYFKKETGENFVDYVTKVRVEKAKELIKLND
jgi:two-component system response regulator YesN